MVLLVAPISAQAQRATKPYRIGVLGVGSPTLLQQDLSDLGYVEGRDVVFEIRNTEGRSERGDDLALDLVRLKVDVIVAANPAAVLSAKRATTTIPIVMMHTPDPVQLGFVSSLAKPTGNITGVTTLSMEMSLKQLEFLREAVSRASRVALLWNPDNPWHSVTVSSLEACTTPARAASSQTRTSPRQGRHRTTFNYSSYSVNDNERLLPRLLRTLGAAGCAETSISACAPPSIPGAVGYAQDAQASEQQTRREVVTVSTRQSRVRRGVGFDQPLGGNAPGREGRTWVGVRMGPMTPGVEARGPGGGHRLAARARSRDTGGYRLAARARSRDTTEIRDARHDDQ